MTGRSWPRGIVPRSNARCCPGPWQLVPELIIGTIAFVIVFAVL